MVVYFKGGNMSDLEHGSTVGGSPILTQRNFTNHQHSPTDINGLGNSAIYDKSDSFALNDTNSIATSKAVNDLRENFESQYMEKQQFSIDLISSPSDDSDDTILVLCPFGGGANEAMGSIYINKSNLNNFSIRRIDILYSSAGEGNNNYDAVIDYVIGAQYSTQESWSLVSFEYDSNTWIGLRRTSTRKKWFSTGYFVGEVSPKIDGVTLTWIDSSDADNISNLNYGQPHYFSNGLPEFKIRAWGNFNGASNAIRAGGNFSHVEQLENGKWEVYFRTPMPDSNYSVTLGNSSSITGAGSEADGHNCHSFKPNSFIIETGNTSTLGANNALICFQVVR